MSQGRLLMLFNPMANSGRAGRLLPEIERTIRQTGVALDTRLGSGPGDCGEWLKDADLAGYSGIIAAGGDGTLFEVVNGLMRQSADQRRPLAVLPVGTGNAFARDLGLASGDWQAGVELLAEGHVRAIDLGQASCPDGTFWFLNIAGMGFVVDAGKSSRKFKFLGKASYTLGTLWQTLRLQSHQLEMTVDGNPLQQDNLFAEVSNSRYTGTSFLMAPRADISDGMLDLTLLKKLPRWRLLKLFPSVYSGRHIEYPEISMLQGRHFLISKPEGYPMIVDGEFIGSTPAEIICIPGGIRMFTRRSAEVT